MTGRLTAEVLTDAAQMTQATSEWDALAVRASRPYCAPGWVLPWWSEVRTADGQLSAVAVRDDSRLVGFAPFYMTRDRSGITTCRLLGASSASYVEPLALAESIGAVAESLALALRALGTTIDVLSLAAMPRTSPWPQLLRAAWSGPFRPRRSLVMTMPAPYVELAAGGYDEWFSKKSRNFRQQLRRRRRDFEHSGGSFRLAESPAEMRLALEQFECLHRHRWAARGGSGALSPQVAQVVRRAGEDLGPARMQIWTAQVNGTPVASALFLAAGDETHYWLGGFDEQWSRCSPSLLLLVEVVRFAAERGLRRVSLGPGGQAYKYRLATGEDQLDWVDLVPRGSRYPYVRVQQLPYRLHRLAVNHAPAEAKQRLRPAMALLRRQRAEEASSGHVHDADGGEHRR